MTIDRSFSKSMGNPTSPYRIADLIAGNRKPPRIGFRGQRRSLPFDKTCEVTETILSLGEGQTRIGDMKYLLWSAKEPEYHHVYLERFLNESMGDYEELLRYAWEHVVWRIIKWMGDPSTSSTSEWLLSWYPTLQCLIERGADVHQGLGWPDVSAYCFILQSADRHCDADEHTHAWLSTLRSCGVSIGPYLERETRSITSLWDRPSRWDGRRNNKKLVTADFEGMASLSWRWDHEPENHREVLEEFQDLIPGFVKPFPPWPCGPDDFRVWLESDSDECEGSFPFNTTPLNYFTGQESWFDQSYLRETYKLAWTIREGRLARREAKKLRAARRRGELQAQRMPGSWVD